MTHVTCRLTAKNRDQLRNPTLDNRVWATFTFLAASIASHGQEVALIDSHVPVRIVQQTTQFSQFIAGALIHSSHNFISSYLHRSSLSVVSLMCQSTKDHADGSVHNCAVDWANETVSPMIKGAEQASNCAACSWPCRARGVSATLYHDAAGRRQSRHWSPGARLTMHLTIYRKFILSLS